MVTHTGKIMNMYSSQCNEDQYLYENYFKDDETQNGFFIELGAMDGVTYSNTLFFERTLGWTGILIEPQVEMYNVLVKNRPNCYNFNYAISEIDGEVEFIGKHAIGGISNTMPQQQKDGWNLNEKSTYLVKSKPIRDVIKEVPIEKVDLFSIDVEGGEYDVLNTFDWNIHVRIILIEMSSYLPEKNEKCREFIKNKNFVFSEKYRGSDIWINQKEVKENA